MESDPQYESTKNIKIYKKFEDMPIFEGSHGVDLLRGIINYGYENPSLIQQRAIMPVAEGHDIIAQSQSGTGKTGTFTIGLLSRIDHRDKNVQAIVLSHTHELSIQTYRVIKKISSSLKTKVELCIGKKIPVNENMANLDSGRHVMIGTPGRVLDLIKRNSFDIRKVKVVILDEADKMLSDKFFEQVQEILFNIEKYSPKFQIGIFSATLPNSVVKMAEEFMKNPIKILVPPEELSLKGIKQYKLEDIVDPNETSKSPFDTKCDILLDINSQKTIPQSIIYVNTAKCAQKLFYVLADNGMSVTFIHGQMSPLERTKAIEQFKSQQSRVLITTDLLSRGIDVQQVMVVFNFDLPYTTQKDKIKIDKHRISEYIHRIGRGGRFGRKGVAINLIVTKDEQRRMEHIEKFFSITIEDFPDPEDLDKVFS